MLEEKTTCWATISSTLQVVVSGLFQMVWGMWWIRNQAAGASADEEPGTLAGAWRFLRRCWWQLLLLPPGCILITALHEAAHALAVIWQGGEVTKFVVLPAGDHWGYVRYEFPDGVAPSNFWITASA